MEPLTLKYSDERDKAYGIAGMAITLTACDGAHLLAEIDLDDDAGSNMHMSNIFAVDGNPRMSAKAVWAQSVKDLRAVTSMALGNIACRRRMLGSAAVGAAADSGLRRLVRELGKDQCGLEADEADALFDSCSGYVRRIFAHSAITGVADGFCKHIIECRRMTATDMVEYLASLGIR